MRKRSSERVAKIDSYIKQHYPENGPDAVAERLGEPRNYIMSRAHYLKVCKKKRKSSSTSVVTASKKGPTLSQRYKSLREENIKLIHENRILRRKCGFPDRC